MDAVSIELPRPYLGQIDMPDEIGSFFDPNAVGLPAVLRFFEQAKFDGGRVFRK